MILQEFEAACADAPKGWLSRTSTHEARLERLRESAARQPGWCGRQRTRGGSHTLQIELRTEPLVPASVIGGLPDLSGYVKSQHLATPAVFDDVGPESFRPGFLPRPDRIGPG